MFHGEAWKLHVDGASHSRGAGTSMVLVSTCGVLHESAITIDYSASDDEAKYEALIVGLRLANILRLKLYWFTVTFN